MMFWGVACYFIGLGMGYGLRSVQVSNTSKNKRVANDELV